jgi:integrase
LRIRGGIIRRRDSRRAESRAATAVGCQDSKHCRTESKLGFHRWTEAEITRFEARHRIGTKPRLALALGLYTGQARQDVVAMRPQHVRDEVLNWVRGKTELTTGIELTIPIHPALRTIIDATPSGHLTFLITELGKPFVVAGFGNWFREQCDIAPLLIPRSSQGGVCSLGRGGLHSARDRGDHGSCEPQRNCPLHQHGRSEAARSIGNGEGESGNNQCQTRREV